MFCHCVLIICCAGWLIFHGYLLMMLNKYNWPTDLDACSHVPVGEQNLCCWRTFLSVCTLPFPYPFLNFSIKICCDGMEQFTSCSLVNWLLHLILALEEIESKGYVKAWRVHSRIGLS